MAQSALVLFFDFMKEMKLAEYVDRHMLRTQSKRNF